jgi:hypothetical protein
MAATVIVRGTDNNQLKAAADDRVAGATATETATGMEMVTVTVTTKMQAPMMALRQQQ